MKKKNLPKTYFEHFEDYLNEPFEKTFQRHLIKTNAIYDENTNELVSQKELDVDDDLALYGLTMMNAYKHSGKKSFFFTEDLCYLLYNTDLKNVDASLFHLPFDTIYIGGFSCLNLHKNIDGVFITRNLNSKKSKDKSIFKLFLFYTSIKELSSLSFWAPIYEGDLLKQLKQETIELFLDNKGRIIIEKMEKSN